MSVIKILDSLLANQIAAGEVVERPASVVKELVENAIDAKASHITIECKHGGKDRILLRDDGCGIAKDDLPLACVRHATSKISNYDDLVQVQSLGFRGEALASVAAVAKLDMTSKTESQDCAWQLSVDAARGEPELKPASHPVGTTIDVQQLFYNTPARRRFLRTDKTEFQHIETVVLRQALSRFDIAFRLTHNDKIVFDMPIADTQAQKEQRIATVFGQEFTQAAVAVNFEAAGLKLMGWIAEAHYNRAQPDQQYAYINGRFIRDKMIMGAVKSAYQDVMFHGRHAAYVLYLACEPASVDVNVHPTKHEVRFRDGRTEYKFIMQSLRQALADQRLSIDNEQEEDVSPERIDFDSGEILTAPPVATAAPAPVMQQAAMPLTTRSMPVSQSIMAKPSLSMAQANTQLQQPYDVSDQAAQEQPVSSQVLGVALAQCHDTYILAQNDKGLVVVDMHAAHERVLFEKMKQQNKNGTIQTQALLVPVTVSLSTHESQAYDSLHDDLAMLGFEIDIIAEQQLIIRQIPVLLARVDIASLVKDCLSDIASGEVTHRVEQLSHQMMANMACKAAVKANHKMTLAEMNHLLRQMESIPHGGLCNHGRPAWKQFSCADMDKWFLRGQ